MDQSPLPLGGLVQGTGSMIGNCSCNVLVDSVYHSFLVDSQHAYNKHLTRSSLVYKAMIYALILQFPPPSNIT